MALRLTRLQKEISDKNEEIRRLQSELLTESDESSALSLRMDDLKRKVKDLEKKNTDLEQRLRDLQLPDSSGPDTDVVITNLKKKLKKMQNEYEALLCTGTGDKRNGDMATAAGVEKKERQGSRSRYFNDAGTNQRIETSWC